MSVTAVIAGVGMTPFGRFFEKNIKQLAGAPIIEAVRDAGLELRDIQAAYMANAAASVMTGQICIPGQVILRALGIGAIPVINVENACASAATAFNQAVMMVELGAYDIVLACGYEKLYSPEKEQAYSVFSGTLDVSDLDSLFRSLNQRMKAVGVTMDVDGAGTNRSIFIDIYATWALEHMKQYGTTKEQFAAVTVKNSFHGSLNPRAQYHTHLSLKEVLSARLICEPLTLPMCSPVGDGAAAAVIMSERKAKELGVLQAVKVASSAIMSGWDYSDPAKGNITRVTASRAYEAAGIGPEDLDVVELHDVTAVSEVLCYEHLGLCGYGEGGRFVQLGESCLGGKTPVNPSGGLLRKGHPIGATGLAQIYELTSQLRGRCGDRQVYGAKVALAENGGGYLGADAGAMVVSVLKV